MSDKSLHIPLVEKLRSVPKDSRSPFKDGQDFPCGELCHEAADALHQAHITTDSMIRHLRAENDDLKARLREANNPRLERILLWVLCSSMAIGLMACAWKFWG